MQKIRINDEVLVIAGKNKGDKGKILKVDEKRNRVFVEGINKVKKALKPTQQNPAGGFAEIEKSIHRSNVMLVSPKNNKRTRVKIVNTNGKNTRVATSCGSTLN